MRIRTCSVARPSAELANQPPRLLPALTMCYTCTTTLANPVDARASDANNIAVLPERKTLKAAQCQTHAHMYTWTSPHRTAHRTAPQNVQGPAADRLLERSIRRYEDEIKPIDADHHGRHSWLPGFLQGGGRTHNRTSSYGEAMPAPGAEGVKTPRKPSPMLPKKSAAKVEKV